MSRSFQDPEKQKPQRGESRQGFEGVNKLEIIHVENHSTNVIPFKFDQRELRTLLVGDQPWFVATDVALALEYAEAKDMTRNLDEDEKGRQIVPTPGGDQEMLVINESGLYSAILRSRKAEAKRFKKWVTAEVLPAIRKHGRYEEEQGKMSTLIGQTIGTDGFHVLGSLVAGKVRALPRELRRRATMKLWAQVHAAFNVRSAEDIPASEMGSARTFIAAYCMEGEWTPARQAEAVQLEIDWPAQRWIDSTDVGTRDRMTFAQGKGHINIMAGMLFDSGRVKPTLDVLKTLEQNGYNVEACKLELAALIHHLSDAHEMLANYRRMASWSEGRGIRFKMAQASA
ncbi:MAG: Bro-N domain-containing protein [Pseudomonas oryzihabitans]|uniref:BRO-N domain-containing protein n=1 Tax=Pseudomonas oryzihabitans TaxID=47885 RepID=UPI00290FCC6E|nr:Bro-N domain-containing protein [Pseudomonas oryzihabitans]MDU4059451.1 Bro-N domain-containing protein [Pseudomonas oryzihabitans]